uniref:1-Cys peroxiredoxin n=1 Tax=Romanomermis culicivorax TaxID=13658 RepID=A0A915JM84_ROMCU
MVSNTGGIKLGDIVPDFRAETSEGPISFHKWLDNSWAILFSHPADYTPVCTTELARVAQLDGEFKKRGVKLIALSCDGVESHKGWIEDIKKYGNVPDVSFPIVADEQRKIALEFGMLDPDEVDSKGLPLTCRSVFIIGPDKKLKLSILYPATTGRNFDEILRAVDSLFLTSKYPVATPVDWKSGDKCMVQPWVKPEDEAVKFPDGVEKVELPSGKAYLRLTKQSLN